MLTRCADTQRRNNRKFRHMFTPASGYYLSRRVKHAKQITRRNFARAAESSGETVRTIAFSHRKFVKLW